MSLRIGIVGAGIMGRAHCQAYLSAGASVRLVHDVDHDAASKLASICGAVAVPHVEDLMSADIDAVSICVPHDQHYRMGMLAAANRRHMLIEKPIAVDCGEAVALVEACRAMQLRVMVGFVNRFHYLQRRLKQQLDAGRFGEVRLITEHLAANGPDSGYPSWYNQRDRAGGGILLMGASHTVDRISWLIDSRVATVFAVAHQHRSFGDVEEVASATLTYESGAVLSLSACRSPVRTHKRLHQCFIYGSKAEAEISFDLDQQMSMCVRDSFGIEHFEAAEHDPFLEMIREFLEAIQQQRDPCPGAQEGLASLAVVRAMYESIETGATVSPFLTENAQTTSNDAKP